MCVDYTTTRDNGAWWSTSASASGTVRVIVIVLVSAHELLSLAGRTPRSQDAFFCCFIFFVDILFGEVATRERYNYNGFLSCFFVVLVSVSTEIPRR